MINLKADIANPSFTGNVGIGITNPGEKLDVNGRIRIENSIVSLKESA